MPFTVPAVPEDEPDAAVPAGTIGEAAEILALIGGLLTADPEAGTAAARFLDAAGADPLPALSWLMEGAGRVAGELEAALPMRASPATASCLATGSGRHD